VSATETNESAAGTARSKRWRHRIQATSLIYRYRGRWDRWTEEETALAVSDQPADQVAAELGRSFYSVAMKRRRVRAELRDSDRCRAADAGASTGPKSV
jgi:hypothetical protein